MQTVYLNGDIAKFGSVWQTDCRNIRDIFKLIECQTPNFRKYLIDASESGISYEIKRGEDLLGNLDDLLLSLNNEDIVITEVPSGSKSGGGKLIAAIALTVLIMNPALLGAGFKGFVDTAIVGELTVGAAGLSIATNLALQGTAQLLAPGPEVDASEANKGYLFGGATNTAVQGMPVPLAYGELIIGGTPISVNYDNRPIAIGTYTNSDDEGKTLIDYTGGAYVPPSNDATTTTSSGSDATDGIGDEGDDYTDNGGEIVVVINDQLYEMTSPDTILEGSTGTISISTTNVSDAIHYWKVNPPGQFATSQGTVSITNNSGSFTVSPSADGVAEEEQFCVVVLYTDAARENFVSATGFTIPAQVAETTEEEKDTVTPGSGGGDEDGEEDPVIPPQEKDNFDDYKGEWEPK